MVTLQTEYGDFQADDEKEVLKLARKAKAEGKKKAAIDEKNKTIAKYKAYEHAYRLYHRKACDEPWPQGFCVVYPHDLKNGHGLKQEQRKDIMTYWGNGSYATGEHYGYRLKAVLEGGGGEHIGVWLTDIDSPRVEFWAIGIEQDQIAFVEVCGIDTTDIRDRRTQTTQGEKK